MEGRLHLTPVLKYLHGKTYTRRLTVADASSGDSDVLDELTSLPDPVTSGALDADLGILWAPGTRWGLGLVARNLLSPSFDSASGGNIQLSPSLCAGTSFRYSLKEWMPGTIALDADLLKVESAILPGVGRRMFSLGIDQGITPFLNLRGGLGKDLAGGDGLLLSTGLGLRIKYFYFDSAVSVSTDKFQLDGKKYPTAGGFGFALGWNMNL